MKTSKKILLALALILMSSLIIFMVKLKNHVKTLKAMTELKYVTESASVFDKLELSSHLIVRIKQGKDCKVEFASDSTNYRPDIRNINGTLYFNADSVYAKDSVHFHVRITMPVVREIKAGSGTDLYLGFFQTDSVKVALGDGCVFKGNNNTLKQVSFETTGKSTIKIISTL